MRRSAVHRHMDAVVVLGAEVNGGKFTILKLRRQGSIAPDQCSSGVGMAFGLKNLVLGNAAQLDGTVHGADIVRFR